jgi:hypothetical protein
MEREAVLTIALCKPRPQPLKIVVVLVPDGWSRSRHGLLQLLFVVGALFHLLFQLLDLCILARVLFHLLPFFAHSFIQVYAGGEGPDDG